MLPTQTEILDAVKSAGKNKAVAGIILTELFYELSTNPQSSNDFDWTYLEWERNSFVLAECCVMFAIQE